MKDETGIKLHQLELMNCGPVWCTITFTLFQFLFVMGGFFCVWFFFVFVFWSNVDSVSLHLNTWQLHWRQDLWGIMLLCKLTDRPRRIVLVCMVACLVNEKQTCT